MYKRFRTAEGKRMKVRMAEEDVKERIGLLISIGLSGLMIAFLLWGAL